MLQAKSNGSYRSSKGNIVFRYLVSGSKSELAAYATAQGEHFRVDEETKKPVFFTTTFVADNVDLMITRKGRVIVDTSVQDKMQALAGGQAGVQAAFAALVAAEQMKNLSKSRHASAAAISEDDNTDISVDGDGVIVDNKAEAETKDEAKDETKSESADDLKEPAEVSAEAGKDDLPF